MDSWVSAARRMWVQPPDRWASLCSRSHSLQVPSKRHRNFSEKRQRTSDFNTPPPECTMKCGVGHTGKERTQIIVLITSRAPGQNATAIALGNNHICALLNNGAVVCWGDNTNGQLGIENTVDVGTQSGQMGSNLRTVSLPPGPAQAGCGCEQPSLFMRCCDTRARTHGRVCSMYTCARTRVYTHEHSLLASTHMRAYAKTKVASFPRTLQ
jgi:hypothetical protein